MQGTATAAPVRPARALPVGLPPGPRLPAPAQTVAWIVRPTTLMEQCRRRFGDVFTLRLAMGDLVFVCDPDDIKRIFTAPPELAHAGEANVFLGPVVGSESILLLDEERHLRQRRLMLPPFHGERMQRYADVMAEVAEREIARWPVGEPFAIWPRMQAVTLEVIMRAVFGVQEGARLDELRTALRRMLHWTTRRWRLFMVAVLGPERLQSHRATGFAAAREPVDALLFDEIRRRRDEPGLSERDDILSLLLAARDEDGRPMGDVELRDELMTLLVAGHETTATALSWTVERLLRHPAALERAREDDDYLEAAIKETLRLRPILPLVARVLKAPFEVGGRRLPEGSVVAPCIYLTHRRADVYPEPEAFRPERFLDSSPGTYEWIPFGGGIRRCLGASFALFEMRMVLRAVLARSELRPAEAESEPIRRRAVTFAPGRGARVVLAR
jgi:cytochrome P450